MSPSFQELAPSDAGAKLVARIRTKTRPCADQYRGGNHLNRLPAPDPQAEVSAAGDRG